MATVIRWTGREARALRQAKRMSLQVFADHLGVTERMVSKWEARGEGICPRPANQEALDTSLTRSPPDVQERFVAFLTQRIPDTDRAPTGATAMAYNEGQVRHPIDGKTMVYIAEGTFLSGPDSVPQLVPGYWIDVFPTTNADFARFVEETGYPPPAHWPSGTCPSTLRQHPVVWVSWHEASAYAAWAGKTLPTSHQWEKAARGPAGTTYPWGDAPTIAKCNVRDSGIGTTTPVDRYHSGASSYGVYDLCGNTWEWLETESEPGRHELKGSAFTSPFLRALPAAFNDASADMKDDDTGFRCVTPELPHP